MNTEETHSKIKFRWTSLHKFSSKLRQRICCSQMKSKYGMGLLILYFIETLIGYVLLWGLKNNLLLRLNNPLKTPDYLNNPLSKHKKVTF